MKENFLQKKMVVALAGVAVCCALAAYFILFARGGLGSDISFETNKMILAKQTQAGELVSEDGKDVLKYRLFVPPHLEAGKTYPIVVWLHGGGGRGDDNLSQLDDGVGAFISDDVQRHQPSFVLVPQCPDKHQWVDMKDDGPPYVNYDIDDVPESIWFKLLLQLIPQLETQHPIDANRRYVVGFSMGAAGVWDIITRHPDFFAAAMPITGKGDPSKVARLKTLPIWAFHGKFDPIAPIENIRTLSSALDEEGGTLKVTELWRKHYIVQHVLKNFEPFRWLYQQKRGGSEQ